MKAPCISVRRKEATGSGEKEVMKHEFYPLQMHIFKLHRDEKIFINYGDYKVSQIVEESLPNFVEVSIKREQNEEIIINNITEVVKWITNYVMTVFNYNKYVEISPHDIYPGPNSNIEEGGVFMSIYLNIKTFIKNDVRAGIMTDMDAVFRLIDELKTFSNVGGVGQPGDFMKTLQSIQEQSISSEEASQSREQIVGNLDKVKFREYIYKKILNRRYIEHSSNAVIVRELLEILTFMNKNVLILNTSTKTNNITDDSYSDESFESYISRLSPEITEVTQDLISKRYYVFCVSGEHLKILLHDFNSKNTGNKTFVNNLQELLGLLNVRNFNNNEIEVVYRRTLEYRKLITDIKNRSSTEYPTYIEYIISQLQKT